MHRRALGSALGALVIAGGLVLPGAASAHTTTVSQDVASSFSTTSGTKGAYLRRVGGATIYSQNAGFQFEPASAIKFLHALHAERRIQSGAATVGQSVAVPTTSNGSCPNESPTANAPLEFAIEKMMENSSNEHTEAIKDEFGQAAINSTALSLGAANSVLQHRVGCGGPLPNRLTLNDITLLYEKAFTDDDVLTPARRDHLWDRMNRSTTSLKEVATEEAQAHWGVNPPAEFMNGIRIAYKPGRYTFCTANDCGSNNVVHRAIAGYVEIPAQVTLLPWQQAAAAPMLDIQQPGRELPTTPGVKVTIKRKYVFGVFISGATTTPESLFTAEWTSGQAQSMAFNSLFRGELKSALDSFL